MDIAKPRDVGRLIRARRRQVGWTQAMLAEFAHTTRRWVSEVENGKTTAEIGLVLATLQALGITLRTDPAVLHPARTEPERSSPSLSELTNLLEQHIDSDVRDARRVSFFRTNR